MDGDFAPRPHLALKDGKRRQRALHGRRGAFSDEFIISLEDGRKLKSLKRYLAGLGMTPGEYRAKWGLPSDYPLVAPSYARARSELAKSMGLGQQRRKR